LYIIALMRVPAATGPSTARGLAAALLAIVVAASACSPRALFRQYEYEEEIYLALDGSATVVVNASIPALVALHGLPLDTNAAARVDRAELRSLLEVPGVEVTRVSRPWRRRGRRYVQVRMNVDDVTRLARHPLFDESDYTFERGGGTIVYRQTIRAAAADVPEAAGWDGSELVGIRMHVPSRIVYHNAPSRAVERGNILAWEQPLRQRLAGTPIEIEVRMEERSILLRTLTIFGVAATAALVLLAAAIFWVWRRGRAAHVTAPRPRGAA
jgi:hypothetical protein